MDPRARGPAWRIGCQRGKSACPRAEQGRRPPFYQSDEARKKCYGGVGLGLAIAQQIAAAHGADLRIQSRPGVGTAVSLYLPAERILPVAAAMPEESRRCAPF